MRKEVSAFVASNAESDFGRLTSTNQSIVLGLCTLDGMTEMEVSFLLHHVDPGAAS